MNYEFERIVIVNRGEPAMRFIHAVREFNQERGTALRTIALFTEPDRHAMFVREADEAVCLGPAQVFDANTRQPKSAYVDYERLQAALMEAKADAVWVGWGFVAEHADFADLCHELGIVFIGPEGAVMRLVGDKIASKRLAEQVHIPVVPWSGGAVETVDDALRQAETLGYPILIKATAGGGGHGIRKVFTADELPRLFESARAEAFKAFGDPTVFLEALVANAHHVEVQVIADHHGNSWAAGVRDCTIQRRHQKVVEEAPSPVLSKEQDKELRQAAVRLSKAANYHNAGTVEFLYDPASETFLFMEMNTRLQVEHPVTECTTGLDLVKLQILIARGGVLEGEPPRTTGHAVEVRLYAEDPDNGFAAAPGLIERFRILTGPGVRVDTGVEEGDIVSNDFDPMIAKIIAYGQTRDEAIARLQRTLRQSVVVIKGGASNRAFLLDLLSREAVQRGDVHIGWLDRLSAEGKLTSRRFADVAIVQAAIESYEAQLSEEQAQFYASALRGRPQVRSEIGRMAALCHRGQSYAPKVFRLGPQRYRVQVNGSRIEAQLTRLGQFEYWLAAFGTRFHIVSVSQGLTYRIEVNGVSHQIDRGDGGVVRAPAPAVVASIVVEPGDVVLAGDRLMVLEAMKMEMPVVAAFSGVVKQVMVIPNVQVGTGAPLVQIDPASSGHAEPPSERVIFSSGPTESTQPSSMGESHGLDELQQLMLGFDVDPKTVAQALADWKESCKTDRANARAAEEEILRSFVDISSLFQRDPEVNHRASAEEPGSEAYLRSYLRMLDTSGEGLPHAFVTALRRALAHYGVDSLERSPQLEESLLWIYKSHQRVDQQTAPVLAILERWLHDLALLQQSGASASLRLLLDRIIAVSSRAYPAIGDLAKELHYRCFDKPLFDRSRKEGYDAVEKQLAEIAANPDAKSQHEVVRALVECPQPLVGLLLSRFAGTNEAMRKLMLEVIASRYYRIRALENFRSFTAEGRVYVSAEYEHRGNRVHLFASHAEYSEIRHALRAIVPMMKEVPPEHDIVIDCYASSRDPLREVDATQQELRAALGEVAFPRPIHRIVVEVAGPWEENGPGRMHHFTFRPSDSGSYEEQKLFRGIHPMMAKRLHFSRLSNFTIERLPSVEDVYLLHAVAHENPKDERLIGCAEVRDVTPVRDENGRVVQLPHLERMLTEATAAMRLVQSRRPPNQRLYWNRILLYVWPPLYLERDEFREIVSRLTPSMQGLGLEQIVVRVRIPNPSSGELRDMVVRLSNPGGNGMLTTFRPADQMQPMKPLSEYEQKVVRMRQRGMIYPYEIIKMLTPAQKHARAEFPPGDFVEYDLDPDGQLVPVDRPYGQNKSNIIAGVIRNYTAKYPEGMTRVVLLGDPIKDLGALAEPECRRIMAALDLAQGMGVPLEWFAISAGAKISMNSGVENMDWIARVLRRLVEFTQPGGEVNLLIDGINVGAQPYWNAEATMLMHTRGILVMTPKAAMVLTGKRALDYSGGVSAEDNQGIGGYDRIMGINGQAQYWARDLDEACHILFRHYDHTYVMPGERFPRRAETVDPVFRDVQTSPHGGNSEDFASIGEIFSDETNPGRKRSFDIRKVMIATIDRDHAPLERWAGMRAAESTVVWDAHLGGYPVCLIGIESRALPRFGFVPADGPDQWTSGTLFPQSSKKVARAINAASNNRPIVVLANLSGFDGSPESMRRLQLEYGAEIGRAIVNFQGPVVFCVISRYHGGAYVVFSRALNENLEVAALEGTHASVIGGAPAAAVVFAGEVEAKTRKDPRLQELNEAIAKAEGTQKSRLRTQFDELFKVVHSEKLGETAAEFDRVHSVQRALQVGALDRIIPPDQLRPYLIDALERGIARVMELEPEKQAVGTKAA